MKKTVTPLRSLCAALAALVLLLALAVPAFAAENGFADLYYRLNDSAEVLTEDEDSELEASLEELSVRQSFDVTIATIDSLESEGYTSMEEYADDLYDYCQFGYGADRDGVLLLVSTGDRKWHISTCGYGITAFTDAGIQYLGEQMTPDMADGDYAAAFHTFIQWTDSYVTAAREGQPYDVDNMPKEPFSIVYLGVALVIGLVTALIVTGVMKGQLKSVAPQRDATDYVRQGSMKLTNQRDLFLYRDVHRTERPKETSSGDSGGSSMCSACKNSVAPSLYNKASLCVRSKIMKSSPEKRLIKCGAITGKTLFFGSICAIRTSPYSAKRRKPRYKCASRSRNCTAFVILSTAGSVSRPHTPRPTLYPNRMNSSIRSSFSGIQVKNARSKRSCASMPIFFGIDTRTRSARRRSVSIYFAPNKHVWSASSTGKIAAGVSFSAKLSNTQERKPLYVPS